MVGLIDIAPAVETVTVRGKPVSVFGVSASGIAYLLGKFPELRMMLSGKTMDSDVLFAMGGSVVAAVIAAGCGSPGDEQAEAVAASLSVSEQVDLLEAVLKLTMPGGVGPFVERLAALGARVGLGASDMVPATKSGKRSKPSLPQDTAPKMHGDIHPSN